MKSVLKLIICVSLFLGVFSGNLMAQVSVTGRIFAEVISTLAAYETSQLNFGRFSPEVNGGDISVTPDDTRSATGTVFLDNGIHNAASF